jgi:hypothetical protein
MLTASRDEYARFTRRVTPVSKGDSIRKLGTRALAVKILNTYYKPFHALKMGHLLVKCPVSIVDDRKPYINWWELDTK